MILVNALLATAFAASMRYVFALPGHETLRVGLAMMVLLSLDEIRSAIKRGLKPADPAPPTPPQRPW